MASLSAAAGLPSPDEGYLATTDGIRLRHASWQAPPAKRQGAILYLNGRTEFIEKTMEVYRVLHRSGFDVWTFDWRGQGLSSRQLVDTEKGHVDDYQAYLDDLHRVIREVTDLSRRPGIRIMLAHSMGGHIGMRYLHDHPGLFDSAVFSAPMIDIPVNRASLRALNAAIIRLGFGASYALSTGRFRPLHANPENPADVGELSDYRARIDRFSDLSRDIGKRRAIEQRIRDNPALALGGPTAAWLDATFRSIDLTWSPGYAEAIDTPISIVSGGQDRIVVGARQAEMARRLPNGRFHVIAEAAHELLVECDDVVVDFFEEFAAFTKLQIDQPPVDMSGCVRR